MSDKSFDQQEQEEQDYLDLVWEVSQLRKELELAQSLHKVAVRERDYERTLCDQYKKQYLEAIEDTEKEVKAALTPIWCSLDTQQKEIQRLRSLCLRAADEIEMLDDIIIRNNYEEQVDEEYPGMASVNLLSRLRGRTKGGYVENYPELMEI
jgi:hypothetical protein